MESSGAEDILSRVHLFSVEQSSGMADLCRRAEKIQGIDIDALTAILAVQNRTIKVEPQDVLQVSGKTLRKLLRDIRSELLHPVSVPRSSGPI